MVLTEIKYQLLRNKGRSILLVCVAALLVGCLAFYLGNIQASEAALRDLSDNIPVTVRIVNRQGTGWKGITIEPARADILREAGVHDVNCTTTAACALSEQARAQDPFFGGDATLLGANRPEALGLTADSFTLADGRDASFLAGAEPVCVVSETLMETCGIQIGDEIKPLVYTAQWYVQGQKFDKVGELALKVIGTYKAANNSIVVPVEWVRSEAEKADVPFYYDSFDAVLDDSTKLSEFKQNLLTTGVFMETFKEAENAFAGDALSVEDELFIKTGSKLRQNLEVFRAFTVPFFVLVVGLVTLVIFLILRSSRKDMAIASSLGRPKSMSALSNFLAVLLADVIGCVIALPAFYFAAGISLTALLAICGVFLLCAAIGTALALCCLLRFDTLELLTKVD